MQALIKKFLFFYNLLTNVHLWRIKNVNKLQSINMEEMTQNESYQRLYNSDIKHIDRHLEKFIQKKEERMRAKFSNEREL